jgi:hypothetical protein
VEEAVTYYKATRPDGRDFQSGTIDYAAALASGAVIRHPEKPVRDDPATYLSVSVEPADCTGFRWPCRLFRVEPVGPVIGSVKRPLNYPHKRALSALRVVEELPAHLAFGPNCEAVVAFIERCRTMTVAQARKLDAARDAAWDAARSAARDAARDAAGAAARDAARDAAGDAAWAAAWDAARDAARDAAWDAAGDTAWDAAGDTAWVIMVRDRITPAQYAVLVQPFVDAGLGEWVA